jgi:quinol-cytochrome oxidoreductase complex cytochrome b subunit
MIGALLVLFIIPFTNTSKVKNTYSRPIFKVFYWLFVIDFIILAWVGYIPITSTSIFIGQLATVYYFLFFIVVIPAVGHLENVLFELKIFKK